jgi:hypothetical protein
MPKPAPTVSTLTIAGSPTDLSASWKAWMSVVDEKDRARMAEIMSQHDVTTVVGLQKLLLHMTVEILRGSVDPSVALAAKPFIDMMAMNIHMMHQAAGSGNAVVDAVKQLVEIKKQTTIQPSYTRRPQAALPDYGEQAEEVVTVTEKIKIEVDS